MIKDRPAIMEIRYIDDGTLAAEPIKLTGPQMDNLSNIIESHAELLTVCEKLIYFADLYADHCSDEMEAIVVSCIAQAEAAIAKARVGK